MLIKHYFNVHQRLFNIYVLQIKLKHVKFYFQNNNTYVYNIIESNSNNILSYNITQNENVHLNGISDMYYENKTYY